MYRNVLICLLGLPASGKTTFCREIIQKVGAHHIIHVPFDRYLPLVNHSVDRTAWNTARNDIRNRVESFLSGKPSEITCPVCLAEPIKCNHILLLDDNFYYRSMRKEYFHLAQKYGCVFGQVVFNTNTENCIQNNRNRSDSFVSTKTIVKMANLIESPCEAWEKHVLYLERIRFFSDGTLQTRVKNVQDFIEVLVMQSAEVDPVFLETEKELERQKNLDNVLQQCEITLRKIISQKIRSDRSNGVIKKYSYYMEIKAMILEKIKRSELQISFEELKSTKFLAKMFDDLS